MPMTHSDSHVFMLMCTYMLFLPQPQKGKVGTKGQKQIMEENAQTLNFYRIMILGSNGLFLILNGFIFSEFATFEIVSQ